MTRQASTAIGRTWRPASSEIVVALSKNYHRGSSIASVVHNLCPVLAVAASVDLAPSSNKDSPPLRYIPASPSTNTNASPSASQFLMPTSISSPVITHTRERPRLRRTASQLSIEAHDNQYNTPPSPRLKRSRTSSSTSLSSLEAHKHHYPSKTPIPSVSIIFNPVPWPTLTPKPRISKHKSKDLIITGELMGSSSRRRAERRAERQNAEREAARKAGTVYNEASRSTSTLASGSTQSGGSYEWSGAKSATGSAAGSGKGSGVTTPSGSGLRRQKGVGNLSTASGGEQKQTPVQGRESRQVATGVDVGAQTRRTSEAVPRTVPRREAKGVVSEPQTRRTSQAVPVQSSAPVAPPKNRDYVWEPSHDKNISEHRPPITRPYPTAAQGGIAGLDYPSEGRLCVDAFEEAYKAGKESLPSALTRKVVDYYEAQVENLVALNFENRGKIAEAMKVVNERLEDVERKSDIYRQLLESKTVGEGWREKMEKAVDIVGLERLKKEVRELKAENEEVKENYRELEVEKREDEEMHEVDQELIRNFEEEEKRKDENIKQLEEDLERARKEIALAGFASRPKLRNSGSGLGDTDSCVTNVDDSAIGQSPPNVSNASTASIISSANAHICMLEMSILHSQKKYIDASQAGAKAERFIGNDPKTLLMIKAWRASNLALSESAEGENIEVAKRLFEDALFLAQAMKGEQRRQGKAWEDKCHAWLLHLADVEAKRGQDSRGTSSSQERANRGAMGRMVCEKQAPAPGEGRRVTLQVPQHTTRLPTSLSDELATAHFDSSSPRTQRSSQELPPLPQPGSNNPPTSPPPHPSSPDLPNQPSRSLADELTNFQSSSPTSTGPRDPHAPNSSSEASGPDLAISIDGFSPTAQVEIEFLSQSGSSDAEPSPTSVDSSPEKRTSVVYFPRHFR